MERLGIFAGDDPFQIARDWLAEAEKSEPNDANAMAVATVDSDGMPNVRILLLKEIEADAFVFYTNYSSQKAEEIEQSGKAAFVLYWKSLRRQIRVRGTVTREDGARADAYYASRALQSRIGAHASQQSKPLGSRQQLIDQVETLSQQLGTNPQRPENWGGYRLSPTQIEFWSDGEFRLHDRFQWSRTESVKAWDIKRLYP